MKYYELCVTAQVKQESQGRDDTQAHHGDALGLLVDHFDDICGACVEEEVARAFSDMEFCLEKEMWTVGVGPCVRETLAGSLEGRVVAGQRAIPGHLGGCRWSPLPDSPSHPPPE